MTTPEPTGAELSDAQLVGNRVRGALRNAGRTQEWLAGLTGMSQPALSRRITGKTAFNVPELHRVAVALEISVDQFTADLRPRP
jgi:transcriptional regulator with XRE-family HTH domain